MRQPFPIVSFICLCCSDTEKQLCPGNAAQFTGLHSPSTCSASASTLPLQNSSLEVGHSSDIPFPWSFRGPPPIQRGLPLLWLPYFFVPLYLPFYSVTLCWVIVIYTFVFSSNYHSCEQGAFVFHLSLCLAYGRCYVTPCEIIRVFFPWLV